MSGAPNPAGIKTLVETLKDFSRTRNRIAELEQSISEEKKSLDLRMVELRGLRALIDEKLREMDVASPRNAGWEQRNFELLLLMAMPPF